MKKIFLSLSLFLFPVVTFANIQNLNDLVNFGIKTINSIIPLLFGIALLAFMWGIIKYLLESNPSKLADARSYIVFSVVGMAVMLSIWGLALFLKNSFFPRAANPGFSQSSSGAPSGAGSNTGALRYCAGSYTVGQSCNHGQGAGTCDNFGQCIR